MKIWLYTLFLLVVNLYNNIISPNNTNDVNSNSYFIHMNEDQLLPKEDLVNFFLNLGINDISRTDLYEQQFIKMEYTIPIRNIHIFDNNKPIFDMRKEHHSPYFNSLNRLIHDLLFQNIKYSYISEYMLIKNEYMKTLWDIIENNNLPDKKYWEKIILSIDKEVILNSGFSEFETYGTFIDNYFRNAYKYKMWFSMIWLNMFKYR